MNVRNLDSLINATGEFTFAPDAATAAAAQAAGYHDFGNIQVVGIKPALELLEHEGSYRGVRTVDAQRGMKAVLEYTLKCDEFDIEKLKYALFGDATTAFTQTSKSTTAWDQLNFGTTAAVINRWYNITVSGVQIRNCTAIVVTGKTENTDYVVDLKLGRVRFLTAQSANLNGTVSAPAVTSSDAGYMQAITPLATYLRNGIGHLALFDDDHDNNLVYEHKDFGCSVSIESIDDMDGKSFATMTLKVKVTTPPGTAYRAE